MAGISPALPVFWK